MERLSINASKTNGDYQMHSQFKAAGITHLKSKLTTLTGMLADIDEQCLITVDQVKRLISDDAERIRKMLEANS